MHRLEAFPQKLNFEKEKVNWRKTGRSKSHSKSPTTVQLAYGYGLCLHELRTERLIRRTVKSTQDSMRVILLTAAKQYRCNIYFSTFFFFSLLCINTQQCTARYFLFITSAYPLRTWKRFECILKNAQISLWPKTVLLIGRQKRTCYRTHLTNKAERIKLWQFPNDNETSVDRIRDFIALTCLHVHIHNALHCIDEREHMW